MSLAPDSDSPSEYESNLPLKLSWMDATHMKNFMGRIGLAHTLQALEAIKRDIQRASIQQNMQAKEQLRQAVNKKANELGFKAQHGSAPWWR